MNATKAALFVQLLTAAWVLAACDSSGNNTATSDDSSNDNADSDRDSSVDAGTKATDPVIPSISGTCPVFETGITAVGELDDIYLQVGPKGSGEGALLFYWHGTASGSDEVDRRLPVEVRDEILADGGIIASFGGTVGTGGNCSGTGIFGKDDFNVADLIVACAVRDHDINPKRIYTTGCSAGGLQSGCMGALRSSYIAAAVPNSGGILAAETIEDNSRIPAVMTIHGGEDDKVIVSFADTSKTYDTLMGNAGSFVVNCNHGGGHCEAPSDLYIAAWAFMKAHPFGTNPSPYTDELPADFPDYCDIF